MVPTLSQINSVHTLQFDFISILILSSNLLVFLKGGFIVLGFPTKILCVFISFPVHATWPGHLILYACAHGYVNFVSGFMLLLEVYRSYEI